MLGDWELEKDFVFHTTVVVLAHVAWTLECVNEVIQLDYLNEDYEITFPCFTRRNLYTVT